MVKKQHGGKDGGGRGSKEARDRGIWDSHPVEFYVPDIFIVLANVIHLTHGRWPSGETSVVPLKLSVEQVVQNNEDIDNDMIDEYLKTEGYKFTRKWFDDVMQLLMKNRWERAQIIGLGSVLITTVTFSAAFTIPGGYNQDNGTPVLGRIYIFRAFILANAMAFIHGFVSLVSLLINVEIDSRDEIFEFANVRFFLAASSMVVAFGLGTYVMLSTVCLPIAILLLVATLFIGSPAVTVVMAIGDVFFKPSNMHQQRNIFITYVGSIVLIFFLALM